MNRNDSGSGWLRVAPVAVCAMLATFAFAGTLSYRIATDTSILSDLICSVGACEEKRTAEAAYRLLDSSSESEKLRAVALLRDIIRMSPTSADAWCNLGDALLASGDKTGARVCFDRAASVGSKSPVLLLRVAGFRFRDQQPEQMLQSLRSVLELVSEYDEIAFSFFRRAGLNLNVILDSGIGKNRRAGNAYLRFVLKEGMTPEAQRTWEWLARQMLLEDPTVLQYVEKLWVAGRQVEASEAWTAHFRPPPQGNADDSTIFNGGFESEPPKGLFDWMLSRYPFLEWNFDQTDPHLGRRALRFEFDGKDNPAAVLARQIVRVKRQRYRFEAFVRSEHLSSEQGVLFAIIAPGPVQRVLATTIQVRGTTPWHKIQEDIRIPQGTDFIEIRVIRQRSLSFDSLLGGRLWIDDVALRPESASAVL